MLLTMKPTEFFTTIRGVRVRAWDARTENGKCCLVLVAGVSASEHLDGEFSELVTPEGGRFLTDGPLVRGETGPTDR